MSSWNAAGGWEEALFLRGSDSSGMRKGGLLISDTKLEELAREGRKWGELAVEQWSAY